MSKVQSSVDLSAFPKQFVTSLRILFDILDGDRTGLVRLCDIESRWNEDGVKGLPSGVVEALRKVTPQSGCLTFELFVHGLKMALLKNNQNSQGKENRGLITDKSKPRPNSAVLAQASGTQMKPHSEKQFHQGYQNSRNSAPSTATVRPNNVLNSTSNAESREQVYSRDQIVQGRTKIAGDKYRSQDTNIPNQSLQSRSNTTSKDSVYQTRNEYSKTRPTSTSLYQSREQVHTTDIPPPRPPPYVSPESDTKIPPTVPPRDKSRMVLAELKTWQREMQVGGSYPAAKDPKLYTTNSDSKLMDRNHSSSSGNEIYVNIEQLRQHDSSPHTVASSHAPKVGVRRQNSRRHTLSSGVDYNMLKRMKQLEQEKDLLLQGLEVVERTRDWYHRQILVVSEKQKALGRTSYSDYNLEANQERMNFQRARIMDVNQHLCTLVESTEKGFPIHMNLAIQTTPTYSDEATIRMLKDQNKQLTEEVSHKNDRITQLEQEKGSLIRELFDSKSNQKSNYDDTTFM
ncbi:hypothetical protein CHS0354_000907 [Potamilus streckersoni]|uniref:Suppressor APC domain-containing protein n=1 Tax=Potamilus streckersoni TaxID=2493646 RepID=A0AAE0VQM4_9BIVA|nr:hypothetical protein CHS0354_000907 [Potamilus streckersoni]